MFAHSKASNTHSLFNIPPHLLMLYYINIKLCEKLKTNIMKKTKVITLIVVFTMSAFSASYAQLFKGFGEKVQKKVENRIERKADRGVDKTLDKGERATDEAARGAVKSSKEKKKENHKQKAKDQTDLPKVAPQPELMMTLSPLECGSFVWYEKGNVFEYQIQNNAGNYDQKNRMEVKNIFTDKGKTIAEIEGMTELNGEDFMLDFKYVCEGDKLYMDVGEMMKSIVANNSDLKKYMKDEKSKEMALDLKNGYVTFPKQLFPGLELDDMSFSFNTSIEGSGKMSIQVEGVDRVVEARESITTPAGTFDCMKIRTVHFTSLNMMGMNREMPAQIEYLWISPKVGVVKQESYEDGNLNSSMQLTNYKL